VIHPVYYTIKVVVVVVVVGSGSVNSIKLHYKYVICCKYGEEKVFSNLLQRQLALYRLIQYNDDVLPRTFITSRVI